MSLAPFTRRPGSHRVTLPWDCLLLIFRECDLASTLATLGRVSLDVLKITAPLLYRDVELKSLKAVSMLFCERIKSKHTNASRINLLLDLDQISTMAFVFTVSLPLAEPWVSPSRLQSGSQLNLRHLRLHFANQPPTGVTSLLTALARGIFRLVNPRRLSCEVHRVWDGDYTWIGFGTMPPAQSLPWSAVESIELKGSLPSIAQSPYALFGLPAPILSKRRVLRLHLDTLRNYDQPSQAAYVVKVVGGHDRDTLGLDTLQPGSVTLVVTSEARRIGAETAVETQVLDQDKPLFVVELET